MAQNTSPSSITISLVALFAILFAIMLNGNDHTMVVHASVECGYVTKHAKPCLEYATGVATEVAPGCCKGLKRLVRNATLPGDKKDVCDCFGKVFKHLPLVKNEKLDAIVNVCKVKVPFKLSKSPDCNNIN